MAQKLKLARSGIAAADHRTVTIPPKQVDPHYSSHEHRAWRDAVIARANGRCQGNGCGRTATRLFADHVIERRDGSADFDVSNGQALCGRCHTRKTAGARADRARGQGV